MTSRFLFLVSVLRAYHILEALNGPVDGSFWTSRRYPSPLPLCASTPSSSSSHIPLIEEKPTLAAMSDYEKKTTAMSDSSMETQSIVDQPTIVLSPEQQALANSGRRKLDTWLIPVMTMFYLLSYLVRSYPSCFLWLWCSIYST